MLSSVQFLNTDLSLSDLEAFFFFSEKKKKWKLSSFLRIFSLTLIQPRRMSEISVSSVTWGFFCHNWQCRSIVRTLHVFNKFSIRIRNKDDNSEEEDANGGGLLKEVREESWKIKIGKGNQGGEGFEHENRLITLELFSLWGILNECLSFEPGISHKE